MLTYILLNHNTNKYIINVDIAITKISIIRYFMQLKTLKTWQLSGKRMKNIFPLFQSVKDRNTVSI